MNRDSKGRLIKGHKLNIGEYNGNWKGDNVGNNSLHSWINRHLPKPYFCEHCNEEPPYDAANITGIYNRDFINWKWYCRRCHIHSDGRIKNFHWYDNGYRNYD